MVFVEDPWSRIVAVHWADEGGPTEPPDRGPPYCGRYGYGARVEDIGAVRSAVPFGPNQLPPMIGTFSTASNTGPAGERYGGFDRATLHPMPTLTAPSSGLVVTNIFLSDSNMTFTNNQLIGIQDVSGNVGMINWAVPMAEGQNATGIPIVIKSYSIEMEWLGHYVDPLDEVGLAVSHPRPGYTGAVPRPPGPAVVLGSALGGSGSFFYDFKYAAWARGDIHVTEANQFDPALGGPALLWWMARRKTGTGMTAWSASAQFMASTLVGLNDHYTWEVIATCQTMPALDSMMAA
jgi:hypothetical protein